MLQYQSEVLVMNNTILHHHHFLRYEYRYQPNYSVDHLIVDRKRIKEVV